MIRLILPATAAACGLLMMPMAHADTTMTAAEICSRVAPGTGPKINPFSGNASCTNAPVPGLFMAAPSVKGWMADNYVGSYPVDPSNPFSDWVIPDGAHKAPSDPSFRWKGDLNEEWKTCPPTSPSY